MNINKIPEFCFILIAKDILESAKEEDPKLVSVLGNLYNVILDRNYAYNVICLYCIHYNINQDSYFEEVFAQFNIQDNNTQLENSKGKIPDFLV